MPIWKYPVHLLAYGFGTGLASVAPGSFGTLVGVGLYRVMGSLRPLHYGLITALMWRRRSRRDVCLVRFALGAPGLAAVDPARMEQ